MTARPQRRATLPKHCSSLVNAQRQGTPAIPRDLHQWRDRTACRSAFEQASLELAIDARPSRGQPVDLIGIRWAVVYLEPGVMLDEVRVTACEDLVKARSPHAGEGYHAILYFLRNGTPDSSVKNPHTYSDCR